MHRAEELQMQINDVLSCFGRCSGCILSSSERKATSPSMGQATLETAIFRLKEHASSLAPLKRVNVIYGIGDHVIYGSDYLVRLHKLGSEVVRAGRPLEKNRSVVFFTTSLVGREEDVIRLLRDVKERLDGDVPFIPQVVLDGRLMNAEKFGPRWKNMVSVAKDLFGRVDLATNLSAEAVSVMPPEQLVSFAEANGFDEVAVNWAPTIANARHTVGDVDNIRKWLIEFDSLADTLPWLNTTYRPVIAKMIKAAEARHGLSMQEVARDIVPETMMKAFEVEPDGTVIPKFEAVGDVTHSARHGLRPIGHINDGPIRNLVADAASTVSARIMAIHAKGACASCRFSPACAGTGFHVATHVGRRTRMAGDEGSCPHVAAALMERMSARVASGLPCQ